MDRLWNAMHLNQGEGDSNRSTSWPHSSVVPSDPNHVMQFKAKASSSNNLQVPVQPLLHTKRKTAMPLDEGPPVPCKKALTEDSMAAHLSNILHISNTSPADPELHNYTINMSQWDFERKLRTAQKITISKELLELDKDGPSDSILPEVLLNRITRPCSALVLWQPPPSLTSLIGEQGNTSKNDDGEKNDEEEAHRIKEEAMET